MLINSDSSLRLFLKHYHGVIDKTLCRETVKSLQSVSFSEHSFYDYVDNKQISYDNELSVSWDHIDQIDPLMGVVWQSLYNYTTDLNSKTFNSWSGFSQVRFNKYTINTKMAPHVDHIQSLFDGERKGIPILTVLGVLNEEFEGGELVFFDDFEIRAKTGDIIVFPSNFLYPHSVNPILRGERYSFVSWAW